MLLTDLCEHWRRMTMVRPLNIGACAELTGHRAPGDLLEVPRVAKGANVPGSTTGARVRVVHQGLASPPIATLATLAWLVRLHANCPPPLGCM